ncbi:hypothetical protein AB7M29_005140 [Pseudomonas sp. F-14 TE3623]
MLRFVNVICESHPAARLSLISTCLSSPAQQQWLYLCVFFSEAFGFGTAGFDSYDSILNQPKAGAGLVH